MQLWGVPMLGPRRRVGYAERIRTTAVGFSALRMRGSSNTHLNKFLTKPSSAVPYRIVISSRTITLPNLRVSIRNPSPGWHCIGRRRLLDPRRYPQTWPTCPSMGLAPSQSPSGYLRIGLPCRKLSIQV